MAIEMGQDYTTTPAIICPHCSFELHILIDGFKPDITKIVKSKCPSCGGEIFACLLILTDITMRGVVDSANVIKGMFAPKNVKIINPSN
jgi:DNA-directed RNA polymerase subunit RPC12/RpoP